MGKFKAVIFDLDGTVFDTEGAQLKSWQMALGAYGAKLRASEYLHYVGNSGQINEALLAKKFGLKIKKGELLAKKEAIVIGIFEKNGIAMMPYALEALADFKRMELRIAAATSAPKKEALHKIKATGLVDYFEAVVARDDVMHGKPHPDIYLLAAKRIGLEPFECLALEDALPGVKSAKAAGMACFAIPNKFTKMQDFMDADKKFASLKDAAAYIKEKKLVEKC